MSIIVPVVVLNVNLNIVVDKHYSCFHNEQHFAQTICTAQNMS
jgi:hypothetical protein